MFSRCVKDRLFFRCFSRVRRSQMVFRAHLLQTQRPVVFKWDKSRGSKCGPVFVSSLLYFHFGCDTNIEGLVSFQSEVSDKLRFTTFYFYFALVVCELILCCFNEKPPLFSNVDTDPVSHARTGHQPCVCLCVSAELIELHQCAQSAIHSQTAHSHGDSLSSFNLPSPLTFSLFPSQNPCPEATAGFLSTITFWWFTRWVRTLLCFFCTILVLCVQIFICYL